MRSVRYRYGEPRDWPAVLRVLEVANFHHVPSPEVPSFDLSRSFVAEIGGRIVGVAGYARLPDGSGKTTLMAVEPESRGLRIGQRLQELRMLALRELGCRVVVTNADLPETIAWYQRKFGYTEVGRVQKLHDFGSLEHDNWTTLQADIDRWHEQFGDGKELETLLKTE